MATIPYMQRAVVAANDAASVYPIVLYARSIQKNTAEFTGGDLRRYLRWLWKVYPTLKLERKWDHGRTWCSTSQASTCGDQAARGSRQSQQPSDRARVPVKDRARRAQQRVVRRRATPCE